MGKQMRAGLKKNTMIAVIIMMLGQNVFAMDCKNIGSRCVEGPEEREVEGYRAHKDCWKYEDSFECKYPSKDNCRELREEGCLRVTQNKEGEKIEECAKEHNGKCLNYKKNYVCYRESEVEEESDRIKLENQKQNKKIKCSKSIKCLDGSCFSSNEEEKKKGQEQNAKDMLNAITQMTAAQNMAKDQLRDDGDTSIVSVFKGESMRCKKNPFLGFKDCCGAKPKGWGTDIGLTRCKADAKAMIERRAAGHCVDLGTYCSEKMKVTGWCLARKQSYCCFGGKLQRIIHEQGRRDQLGISFGSAKHSDCRGLTVEELSRLKFDKIDFNEYYKEVMAKYNTPDASGQSSRISEAFKGIQQDFESSGGDEVEPKDRTNQVPFRNKKFESEVIDEDTGISSRRSHM